MELQEMKQVLRENGIIGAGGAGFPTYGKLDQRVETIILNCAECEPLLKVHRQLLEKHPYEILEALGELAQAMEAGEVIIAIKRAYAGTVAALEEVLADKELKVPVRFGFLQEVYPAGDEVITIYEVTGKVVPPGKIPLEVGVAVFNVETVYNVYRAIFFQQPVTHKYLTLAGEVMHPKTVRVPIGMAIEEVLQLAGGVTVEDPVYLHGGPMTGNLVSEKEPITKTSNAILVFSRQQPFILKKCSSDSVNMKRAMAACCQCRMCTDLCPRNLLGHPIEPHAFMRAATTGVTKDLAPFLNTFSCSQCGLCETYACMQGLSPSTLISHYKNELRKEGVKPDPNPAQREVDTLREQRKVPMERLTARLGLLKYDVPAPLEEREEETSLLKIRWNQHIGAPAVPLVQKGDWVTRNQPIARAEADQLGVSYHAPCEGTILEVTAQYALVQTKAKHVGKGC